MTDSQSPTLTARLREARVRANLSIVRALMKTGGEEAVADHIGRLRQERDALKSLPDVACTMGCSTHSSCPIHGTEVINRVLLAAGEAKGMCVCGHSPDEHGNDGTGHCGATPTCRSGKCERFTLVAAGEATPQPDRDA